MNYKFPLIKTLDDVKHAIDTNYFTVADRGSHVIINYNHASLEVFPDIEKDCDIASIRREFRGIIFDSSGKIIRRPFHKFFNLNERTETILENVDISKEHLVYVKLDGSMIAPFYDNGTMIWGTKMGDTDVSKQVYPFLKKHDHYYHFAEKCIEDGFTPIFEWCSRKQRIVLDYPRDSLLLTAIRHMETGKYCSSKEMVDMIQPFFYGIPICQNLGHKQILEKSFVEHTRGLKDSEGYVIRFSDGHMLKIKSEWYCELHRIKSQIESEKGILSLILNESIDDLKPLMMKDDLLRIETYEIEFWKSFSDSVDFIFNMLVHLDNSRTTRKDFALTVAPTLESYEKSICFSFYGSEFNKQKISLMLKDIILKHCYKNSKFEEIRSTKLFENVNPWKEIKHDE